MTDEQLQQWAYEITRDMSYAHCERMSRRDPKELYSMLQVLLQIGKLNDTEILPCEEKERVASAIIAAAKRKVNLC